MKTLFSLRKKMLIGILFLGISNHSYSTDEEGVINLKDPQFNASGDGDITTVGSIEKESKSLIIDDPETWSIEHGIRIHRAGKELALHHADSGWALAPNAPSGAEVSHEAADMKEGLASVRCTFTGNQTTDNNGELEPVDLCEVDLLKLVNLESDELRFWVKSTSSVKEGELQIRLLNLDREYTFELAVPTLDTNWTEVFLALERRTAESNRLFDSGGNTEIISLRCLKQCDGLEVYLDHFSLVSDLVTAVEDINELPSGNSEFQLTDAASRSVVDEIVYHDDAVAVRKWLQQANQSKGVHLLAPPGVYYLSRVPGISLPLYNNLRLHCADATTTIFKNTGRSATGTTAFVSAETAPKNIRIENCGFDLNGWNRGDFSDVVIIRGDTQARNIHIRGNNFFDSNPPGIEGCDQDQDKCATRQRQYILVLNVKNVWIENNHLSGGGRIKAGRPGKNMYIRNNIIDFVNDNGITIVDVGKINDDACISAGRKITKNVEITGNTIINPVSSGIFFGVDGQITDDPGFETKNITIKGNKVSGFFTGAGIRGILPGGGAKNIYITNNDIESIRGSKFDTPKNPNGIEIQRGNCAREAVSNLFINDNKVVVLGGQSEFDSGFFFNGREPTMTDISIENNNILCDNCARLEKGIYFHNGNFEKISVKHNHITAASNAFKLGRADTAVSMKNVLIENNFFFDSTNKSSGQVSLIVSPEQLVEAKISENIIQGGSGYGIYCKNDGELFITDLLSNQYLNNENGPLSKDCR